MSYCTINFGYYPCIILDPIYLAQDKKQRHLILKVEAENYHLIELHFFSRTCLILYLGFYFSFC